MKNFIGYLLVFVIAIIIFAISTAPTFLLTQPLKKVKHLLTIEHLSGKIINGSVQNITLKPKLFSKLTIPNKGTDFNIKTIDWNINLSQLQALELGLDIKLSLLKTLWQNPINFSIFVKKDQTIILKDLKTKTSLAPLFVLFGQNKFADAQILINIDEFINKLGKIQEISGRIVIKNLVLFEQKIGQLVADISFDKKQRLIIIKPSSINAKIDISGLIKLDTKGNYNISIKLSPKASTTEDLTDMLSLVGYASGKNRIFKQTGKF